MIDAHCHLAGREFAGDLDAVVGRALEAGLTRCLCILDAEDEAEFEQVGRLERLWPQVRYAAGVHPHHAGRFAADPDAAAALVSQRVDRVGACAVGEIGLDYHYDFSPREVQQAVFRAQLRLARARNLPVVIHTREAEEDTLRILAEEAAGGLQGMFHCFTGDAAAARRALSTGFYVSIPGIATFPPAEALRDAARQLPSDRILIETDSPYLAPVPYRGRRNEPAYVVKTGELVASLRGISPGALAATLVDNFDRLFGAPGSPPLRGSGPAA
jgi:TatD DNase family protein